MIPMMLNGHAGTKYGVPFPVLLRASFGTTGAMLPAMLRGLVACGWFGIQTWVGGFAIYQILNAVSGDAFVGALLAGMIYYLLMRFDFQRGREQVRPPSH